MPRKIGPRVLILTTDAPGQYPIVGIGDGDVMAFDVNGGFNPMYGGKRFNDLEVKFNSLLAPEPVTLTRYLVMDPTDGWIDSTVYDTWEAAADTLADDEVIIELHGIGYRYGEGEKLAEAMEDVISPPPAMPLSLPLPRAGSLAL